MKNNLVSLITKAFKPSLAIFGAFLVAGLLSFSQIANAATPYYVSGTDVYARARAGGHAIGRLYKNQRMDIQYIDREGYAYGYIYGYVNRCGWAQLRAYNTTYFWTNGATVSNSCRSTNMYLDSSEYTNGETWSDSSGTDGMLYTLPRGTYVWDNWSWHSRWGNYNYRGYAPAGSRFKIRYTTNDGGGVMARSCTSTGCSSDWVFIQRSSIDTIRCGYLMSGEGLGNGRTLNSCDGRFSLTMQTDGNLVLYQSGGGALWATGTPGNSGRNVTAFMQTDGNFVVYANPWSSWIPLWSSGTWGQPGSYLALQNDGNLVVYNQHNNWTWASHTCCR
jgi:hypothetical protein